MTDLLTTEEMRRVDIVSHRVIIKGREVHIAIGRLIYNADGTIADFVMLDVEQLNASLLDARARIQ